jgi:hypothetical protein
MALTLKRRTLLEVLLRSKARVLEGVWVVMELEWTVVDDRDDGSHLLLLCICFLFEPRLRNRGGNDEIPQLLLTRSVLDFYVYTFLCRAAFNINEFVDIIKYSLRCCLMCPSMYGTSWCSVLMLQSGGCLY